MLALVERQQEREARRGTGRGRALLGVTRGLAGRQLRGEHAQLRVHAAALGAQRHHLARRRRHDLARRRARGAARRCAGHLRAPARVSRAGTARRYVRAAGRGRCPRAVPCQLSALDLRAPLLARPPRQPLPAGGAVGARVMLRRQLGNALRSPASRHTAVFAHGTAAWHVPTRATSSAPLVGHW